MQKRQTICKNQSNMIDLKSRVLRTLMPRKARHAVSYDT